MRAVLGESGRGRPYGYGLDHGAEWSLTRPERGELLLVVRALSRYAASTAVERAHEAHGRLGLGDRL